MAFVAGIASIVLLERGGWVSINRAINANPAAPDGLSRDLHGSDAVVIGVDSEPPVNLSERSDSSNNDANDAVMSSEHLSERIDQLQQQVRSATVKADMMQSKINALEQQMETIPIGAEFLPDGQNSTALPGEALVLQENQAEVRQNRASRFASPDNDVEVTSLVSAGVDPLVAEQIKQRSDQWTLQRLELVDQATREGWRQSDQFSERLAALREERPSIRDELGDSGYDRYLYASGESNRVQISNIITGSAAQIAGMENGDVVFSYANRRVFTIRELQRATSEGSRGEPVLLEVLRSGEQINIELPRGPMGVTLTGKRVEPS